MISDSTSGCLSFRRYLVRNSGQRLSRAKSDCCGRDGETDHSILRRLARYVGCNRPHNFYHDRDTKLVYRLGLNIVS